METNLYEIRNTLSEISQHLEDINKILYNNIEAIFTCRVGHVLTSSFSDTMKLNLIKIFYRQMAWPDTELTEGENELIERLK
jgi:hypothetical protein